MAPTKATTKPTTGGTVEQPIDLTVAADAIATGRVTKPKPTPKKKKPTNPAGEKANPPTKGKASGPACAHCKKIKARCDRILACERCLRAGVACSNATSEEGNGDEGAGAAAAGAAGKPPKACERCKKLKAACVRSTKCVKCEKKGIDCVVA